MVYEVYRPIGSGAAGWLQDNRTGKSQRNVATAFKDKAGWRAKCSTERKSIIPLVRHCS
ncbi:hypothetical protein BT69DRAFT_1277427 [Atractiella rhizophila]|nr:hypothetical protein BT69DRAFT_1277427 [Atractiella rhizophila]